jgi:hypothetical protein
MEAPHCALLRDIIGNPCHAATIDKNWLTANGSNVRLLANVIYEEKRYTGLAALADALQQAGCTNAAILAHCRQATDHVRGCWVVDLLLDKNAGANARVTESTPLRDDEILWPQPPEYLTILQELVNALIRYTPEHFKTIHCTVTAGLEHGQHALFYEISCPEYPDQGTTDPSAEVHRAASKLLALSLNSESKFPGYKLVLTEQPDGSWKNSVAVLDQPSQNRGERPSGT